MIPILEVELRVWWEYSLFNTVIATVQYILLDHHVVVIFMIL